MLKITKRADYAVLLLAHLARGSDSVEPKMSATELAEAADLPRPMVTKVLKELSTAGLLTSTRGPRGGYLLARRPEEITVADILRAVEGPIGLTDCGEERCDCARTEQCLTQSGWRRIDDAVRQALGAVTIAQMSASPLPSHLRSTKCQPASGTGDAATSEEVMR